MKIRLNANQLPPTSCGDPSTDVVFITGKEVYCENVRPDDGLLVIEITDGTADDIQRLQANGYSIEAL